MNEYQVKDEMVIGMRYTLTVDGKLEDQTDPQTQFEFIQGEGNIIPGLEKGLEGMKVGEKKTITVTEDEGYGPYDDDAIIDLDKNAFPPKYDLSLGNPISLVDDAGQHCTAYIHHVDADKVWVDLNHPMAGKTLVFDVEIVSIRPATEEELNEGHLHDDDCGCSDCSSCSGCSGCG